MEDKTPKSARSFPDGYTRKFMPKRSLQHGLEWYDEMRHAENRSSAYDARQIRAFEKSAKKLRKMTDDQLVKMATVKK
jgi:hypothetical protein